MHAKNYNNTLFSRNRDRDLSLLNHNIMPGRPASGGKNKKTADRDIGRHPYEK